MESLFSALAVFGILGAFGCLVAAGLTPGDPLPPLACGALFGLVGFGGAVGVLREVRK